MKITTLNQVQMGQEVSTISGGGHVRGVVTKINDDQVSITYEVKMLRASFREPMEVKEFNTVKSLSKGEIFLVN